MHLNRSLSSYSFLLVIDLGSQSLNYFSSFYETSAAISTLMYQCVVCSFSIMILQENKFTCNIIKCHHLLQLDPLNMLRYKNNPKIFHFEDYTFKCLIKTSSDTGEKLHVFIRYWRKQFFVLIWY
jgi:hypothetical protein